jgi:hypothetical protein
MMDGCGYSAVWNPSVPQRDRAAAEGMRDIAGDLIALGRLRA